MIDGFCSETTNSAEHLRNGINIISLTTTKNPEHLENDIWVSEVPKQWTPHKFMSNLDESEPHLDRNCFAKTISIQRRAHFTADET